MTEIYPLQALLLALAGFVNRRQQAVIQYLLEENRVLKEQLGGRRLRLTDAQRRRLAAKAKRLGRHLLSQVATIVTPDTLLRWHRRLIALKWTYSSGRVGRPGIMKKIRQLIVRMAEEDSRWGYCRIQGALRNLGHRVAPSTIAKVLQDHGIKPAPDRPSSWRSFLRVHMGQIFGADFFTAEVWTPRGLVTYYVLVAIDLKTRRVEFAGATPNPGEPFMTQVARNLTFAVDGVLAQARFLICDRDGKFSPTFKQLLTGAGVRIVLTPYQAPNANAHIERFIRSIKDECLNRMFFFGEDHLRHAITEYLAHYHRERNHQGIANELIDPALSSDEGEVVCRERLGGMLRYYHRAA